MKAIIIKGKGKVALENVAQPSHPAPRHLIIKMHASAINPGDLLNIAGTMPPGFFPASKYDVAGVSGAGEVVAVGEGVPARFIGKCVTVYRSLRFSDELVGTWSEYSQLHYLQCAILPSHSKPVDYAGSLVNIITPYAFYQQIKDNHKGIVSTAGNSATGRAMIGIGQALGFPVLSIVRNDKAKHELLALGAKNVLVQSDEDFRQQFKDLAAQLQATAVFDGVGGTLLSSVVSVLPPASDVYSYGFLSGAENLSLHTSLLMTGMTIRGFSNFRTDTVQNPEKLEAALEHISSFIDHPLFSTRIGQEFRLEDIEKALAYTSDDGGKALIRLL